MRIPFLPGLSVLRNLSNPSYASSSLTHSITVQIFESFIESLHSLLPTRIFELSDFLSKNGNRFTSDVIRTYG